MKNAWKQEINLKKKGKRVLPASKDKNLAKILKENDKNWWWSQEPTRRERKAWKSLNSDFEKVLFCFLKNLIREFWSVENQSRPVETDRGSQNFWEKTQFWKKQRHILEIPQSIEIYEQNAWVYDKMYFRKKVLNLVFPKLRFLTFSINFQATNLVCT